MAMAIHTPVLQVNWVTNRKLNVVRPQGPSGSEVPLRRFSPNGKNWLSTAGAFAFGIVFVFVAEN